jgi:uncharacterized protein YecE (DUF72 family)
MGTAERLRYYATQFSLVEADGTYYRPPSAQLAQSWAERSPEGFCFDIKAYGLLTGHPVDPVTLWPDIREAAASGRGERGHGEPGGRAAPGQGRPGQGRPGQGRVYAHHLPTDAVDEAWARFMDALRPLRDAGKLGAVLLQYPPWFGPKRSNRDELALLPSRLGGVTGCVEFRSPAWLAPEERSRTLGLLRELGLAHVAVDAPASSGLEPVVEVTRDDLAVTRFHGRADSTWKARNVSAAERFRYLYGEEELLEWAPRARAMAERASRVHLLMNNCYQDYGVRNAAQLARLLEEGRLGAG